MALILRRFGADGAAQQQVVEGEIGVGRATDNQIELPGLLVALHHFSLKPVSDLRLRLECAPGFDVVINDLPGQKIAELVAGDEIRVGGHELRIGVDASGTHLLIELREHDARSETGSTEAITHLAAAGWNMRRLAYIGLLLVLVVALLLPLLSRPFEFAPWARSVLPTDALWSSGPLSLAHAVIGNDCSNCHESLFGQVRDEACLSCHAGIAQHSDNAVAMQEAGFAQQRCASCHLEHGSEHAVLPAHPDLCTDCHAAPEEWRALPDGRAVEDFADAHPPFRVHHTAAIQDQRPEMRSDLKAGLLDRTGLVFPHDLHLEPEGVRGPDGDEVLVCASCHVPGPGGAGFQSLRFVNHCQRCHQLDVDLGDLAFRLPHGDSEDVRNLLEAAVGDAVVTEPPQAETETRRRPGEQADRGDDAPLDPIDQIFERRVCGKCHETQRAENEPVSVRIPRLRQSWMTSAHFTHAPHRWVECGICHAAKASKNSDELMLPQVDTCRECHGGVDSVGQIQSTCIDCHRFHQAKSAQMGKVANMASTDAAIGQTRPPLPQATPASGMSIP